MRSHTILAIVSAAGACSLLAPGGYSQGSAASKSYLLVGSEQGPAMIAVSPNYRVVGGTGSGFVPARTASTGYVLRGGYPAAFETTTTGRPWLLAMTPPTSPLAGKTAHVLRGVELHLGGSAAVKVGGVPATVTSRTATDVGIALGTQAQPGFHDVELDNGIQRSYLSRGLGVLPLLEIERPFDAGGSYGSEIVFRGTQGDVVVFLLAAGNGPVKVPLPGYGWFYELDLATMLVVTARAAPSPDGIARLPLPAVRFARPLHCQGLVLSPTAPYKPGAFTNVVGL